MPLPPPPPPGSPSGPPSRPGSNPASGSGLPQPSGPPAARSGRPPETTTCYRHPGRPAGRRCTRCGRPACGECLVQASVGSHCVECARAAKPDIRTRARYWQAGQGALVTYTLIAINVGAFVLLGLYYDLPGMLAGQMTEAQVRFGLNELFVSGQAGAFFNPATGMPDFTSGDEWYRLVTSGFLHFGLIHLGFNMLFLYRLGEELEPLLGRVRFGLLYGASLLGGSAGVLLVGQGGIAAGASGAVFGLMGAYAVGLWRHGVNPFTTGIGALLLINLVLTFAISNISIGGHIGGALAGAVCGAVMLAPRYRAVPRWATFATPVAVGAASLVLSVVAVGG